MNVAMLAERAGVSAHTVRYYDRVGLLTRPRRTASDYRDYDDKALDRLRFIRGAQRLGLRLREIRELLAVRDTGECPCEPAADLLARRAAEIDAEVERLAALRAEIVTMAARIAADDCADSEPECCGEVSPNDGNLVLLLRRPEM